MLEAEATDVGHGLQGRAGTLPEVLQKMPELCEETPHLCTCRQPGTS
jgi:hypothetical protein